MKTYKTITVAKEDEVVTSVTCNKCGKQRVIDEEDTLGFAEENQFPTINLSFGYGSVFDTDYWHFELCEECLIGIVRDFKYLPEGYDKEYVDKKFPAESK